MVADNTSTRPVALEPDPDGMPAELRALSQWVTHRDKAPCCALADKRSEDGRSLYGAKIDGTDKDNLAGFDDACRAAVDNGHDGIGFSTLALDPYILIDFDHCVRADGSITPLVLMWVRRLLSYTEYSPSRTGIHIVVRGRLPGTDNRFTVVDPTSREQYNVEVYDRDRYFRITGRTPEGLPTQIVDNQEAVDAFYAWREEQDPRRGKASGHAGAQQGDGLTSPAMTDEEILLRARNARNGVGAAFVALFDRGEIKDHGADHSAADLSLCCRVAFWTQDADQIDRLFRKSKLVRPKWDERRGRQTYGAMTVAKALELTTDHYSPPPEPEDEPASGAPVDAAEAGQDGAAGLQWTGPRDWQIQGPVTRAEARAMTREQLEHYIITWSRLQYDLYHLLTNQARVIDPDSGKERRVLNPTDKVTIACTWLEANRVPGVEYPHGHSHVRVRREAIARQAGVSADTVGRCLDHGAAVGLITNDCVKVVQGDRIVQDMYVGAPAKMPRNIEPLPTVQDAEHRARDRKRKTCRHCGASVFVHKTVCGACGEVLEVSVDGEDEQAVNELRDRLQP